ncbi:protein FAM161A isoform X2 [Apis cerana]|uniref:protein FAM161A isoform X2 n=1 Tax=Apis cerana TaxID=7461 RepID=UPI00109BD599|nr:protein FAM161A isoform X2 [Apis cerana]
MTEHKGTSFYNSCVKVPVNPYNRQPTPSYERLESKKNKEDNDFYNKYNMNFIKNDHFVTEYKISNSTEDMDIFLEFLDSIPDYGQVYHLSNEQFKQKVDYLKRKQKLLLKNLQNSLVDHENINESKFSVSNQKLKLKSKNDINDLALNGKKCYLEESSSPSPLLFLSNKLNENEISEHQDFLTNRRDKENGTECKEKIYLNNKNWNTCDKINTNDNIESDIDNAETRSLPANITKEWHPTVPKPFNFTLREEAEKHMKHIKMEEQKYKNVRNNKKNVCRKRRVRSIPLTSKIPLYDKLLAEKEERSRIIREESALNLMSQVRPFKLECDRRAWRFLARSSPEIHSKNINMNTKFKAKPVPKNLFSTEIYDRMLEDEYGRQLQKRLRAAQLMKSSSLPPSMARRERIKSACTHLQSTFKDCNKNIENKNISQMSNNNSISLERCKSMMPLLPIRGNNLAAILRCQVSREKLEREIREKMEERRREQAVKIKQSLIGRNPVWRALRSAVRHEHERDLNIRTLLRRDEAREQAERHRLQMEMMLDRVTQIPTLFERHSQSYQSLTQTQKNINNSKMLQRRKKKKEESSTMNSYINYENISKSDSESLTSSSDSPLSNQSLNSSSTSISQISEKSITKSQTLLSKKKADRSQLKVSIKETAELIEDQNKSKKLCNNEYLISNDNCNKNTLHNNHNIEIITDVQ